VTLAPAGPNPVVNGGFETGSLSGWTSTGPASVVSSGQHAGAHAAQVGSSVDATDGTFSISQTFTARAGDSAVSFWYQVTCGSFYWGTDGASATLTDNTAGTTTTALQPDCPIGATDWSTISVPVLPGHSYTLTLADTDSMAPSTWTLYDDVSVY
jgi:hypothetical protein